MKQSDIEREAGLGQSSYRYLEEEAQSVRVDVLMRAVLAYLGENPSHETVIFKWLTQDAKKVEKALLDKPTWAKSEKAKL